MTFLQKKQQGRDPSAVRYCMLGFVLLVVTMLMVPAPMPVQATSVSVDLSVCNDGVIEVEEKCEDYNADDSDDCRSDCQVNKCGDGVLHTSNSNSDPDDTILDIIYKEAIATKKKLNLSHGETDVFHSLSPDVKNALSPHVKLKSDSSCVIM